MRELEIALAIALSFLIFSTFSSMVLELLYRLLKTRYEGLKAMLFELCSKELSSFIKNNSNNNSNQGYTNELENRNNQPNFLHQIFNKLFNNSKTMLPKPGSHHKVNEKNFPSMVAHLVKDTMTTAQFIERLATTDAGKEIAKYGQEELTILVGHVGRRYDAFCEVATQSFKKKSETYIMVISVGMALVLNINVVTLGNVFIENRSLTNELVAQTNVIMEQAKQLAFWGIAGTSWIITTVITGLLIGLGGAFWFDMVKRISVFRSTLSSATTDKNQTQEQATGNDKESSKDLVKIFEETVKAAELIANMHQPYLPPAPNSVRLG